MPVFDKSVRTFRWNHRNDTIVFHSSHVNSGNSHKMNSTVFICVTSLLELYAYRNGKCYMQMGKERIVDKCNARMSCAHVHISVSHLALLMK